MKLKDMPIEDLVWLSLIVTCLCLIITYLEFKGLKKTTKNIDNLKVEFAIVYLII